MSWALSMRPIMLRITEPMIFQRGSHAEIGRLLHHKAHPGQLERLDKVVVHSGIGQFHNEFSQRPPVLFGIFGLLERIQQLEGLGLEFVRIEEAQGWVGGVMHDITCFQW